MILQEDLSKLSGYSDDSRQHHYTDDIVLQKMANQAKFENDHCWDINDTSLPKVNNFIINFLYLKLILLFKECCER